MADIETLLKIDAVIALTGQSRSKIYQMVVASEFPAPVKVGSSSFWPESEVAKWIVDRIDERDKFLKAAALDLAARGIAAVPVKRGRGRPRKLPPSAVSAP